MSGSLVESKSNPVILTGWELIGLVISLATGALINAIDFSIANVAIPSIAGDFGVTNSECTWVITLYSVSSVISLGLSAWLAKRYGSYNSMLAAIIIFTVFSFLCGAAWDFNSLVIFRILQGTASGSLMALPQSMIMEHCPPSSRRFSISIILVALAVGPLLGPVIGGVITEEYGWRWIFYINVPFGIFAALIFYLVLGGKTSGSRSKGSVDYVAILLLCVGLMSLQIFLDRGNEEDWFDSTKIVTLGVVSLVSSVLFVIWNKYSDAQILKTGFFWDLNFTVSTLLLSVLMLMINGTFLLFPLYLQTQMHYTPLQSGLAIMPTGIMPILIAPLIPFMIKFIDMRVLICIGFIICAYANFLSSGLTPQATLSDIVVTRVILGAGTILILLPIQQLAMVNIPLVAITEATGVFNFMRIFLGGGGTGTALYVTFWQRRESLHHSNLTEVMTPLREVTKEVYDSMSNLGVNDSSIASILDLLVTNQAYTIALNDLLWLSGWAMLAVFPFIWLCKLPRHES